jgi:hypothetical protein
MVSNQLKLPSNNSIQFLEKLFTTPTLFKKEFKNAHTTMIIPTKIYQKLILKIELQEIQNNSILTSINDLINQEIDDYINAINQQKSNTLLTLNSLTDNI